MNYIEYIGYSNLIIVVSILVDILIYKRIIRQSNKLNRKFDLVMRRLKVFDKEELAKLDMQNKKKSRRRIFKFLKN